MKSNHPSLILAFATAYGRFVISPAEKQPNIFELKIVDSEDVTLALDLHCSINDAILAVANQETSYEKWDQLCLENVPYKVHDITCWEFDNFSGTNETRLCS